MLSLLKLKQYVKHLTPHFIRLCYNRFISRIIIKRKYGPNFRIDWKKESPTASTSSWTQVYDASWVDWEGPDLAPQDIELIKAQLQPQDRVLDAGCGDGYLLESLTTDKNNLVGLDVSINALNRARRRLGSRTLLIQAFLEVLPFIDNCFDVIICAHTLEHLRDLDRAVKEMARVAKRKLIILVPAQKYLPYTEDYHLHFFPNEAELLRRINLPRAKCIRYRNPPGKYKYQGDLLFLTVDLQRTKNN